MENHDGSFSSYHGYENHWQQQGNGNPYDSFFGDNAPGPLHDDNNDNLHYGHGVAPAFEHNSYPAAAPQYAQYDYSNPNYPQQIVHPTFYAPSTTDNGQEFYGHGHAHAVPSWSDAQSANNVDDNSFHQQQVQGQSSSYQPQHQEEGESSDEISLQAVHEDPVAVYGWPISDTQWKKQFSGDSVKKISSTYQTIGAGEKRTKQRHLKEKCNVMVALDLLSSDVRRQERAALYMHTLQLPVGVGQAKTYWKGDFWDIIHEMASSLQWDVGVVLAELDPNLTESMAAKLDSKFHFAEGLHEFVQAVSLDRYRKS